ncbi:hypothetical protein JG687_00018966 [Phytophthora cactorum]|uniref:Uncharacterized protein n=1 Tax=Phytophthora cactorum TaxID=29920 RepID=A0A8T1TJS0_9STRA|nr:hypothetical protein JG687_00018966 [Phytophthora cactorum]
MTVLDACYIRPKQTKKEVGPRTHAISTRTLHSHHAAGCSLSVVYLVSNPTLKAGKHFPGSNQNSRFCKALGKLLENITGEKVYARHSIRKGVATYASSSSTRGPSIVRVCVRCGWSLGGVQDRYFRYEAAGDQYLGRVVAGLPRNSAEFAVLPPHFEDPTDLYRSIGRETITREALGSTIRSLLQEAGLWQSQTAASPQPSPQYQRGTTYYWPSDGRFHRMPEDFKFPQLDALSVWRLWWLGNPAAGYPSFRTLQASDFVSSNRKMYSEWSFLVWHIITGAESGSGAECSALTVKKRQIVSTG